MSAKDKKAWVKLIEIVVEIGGIILMVAPFLIRGGKRRKK